MEDEGPLLALLVEEFEEAGFQVIWAGSGEDALWLMRTAPNAEVLVTDIRLRGPLNGWDVAEHFRKLNPKAPVIYTSGFSDVPARFVPNSIFLQKPYLPAQCIAEIQRLTAAVA